MSKDTLLRVVRRRSRRLLDPLRVIGIDDWAWRRNHRYASIICNLEKRRIAALLPNHANSRPPRPRGLGPHPAISIVARDRGGGYGEAAGGAVAARGQDGWH